MTPASPSARRGSFALRDRPGPVWLGLAAALALVHPWVPGSTWLLVHLVLLGALTHSAMVWSTHFTQALLKTPESLDNRTRQSRRIIVLSVGVCAVLVGVPSGWWPLTVAGATAVSAAVIWHGISLWQRLRRALPGRFRVTVRYYIAAAACVPVGATLGAWLARGLDDQRDGEVLVAHSMVMVLGWIGLTVTGTLITLWPTMLRTRMDARAERLARQALPVLLVGLAVLATGAALGSRAAALAGLGGYAAGLGWWGRALVAPARQAPPKAFATWSVSAALGWWVVALALLGWRLVTSASWAALADGYGTVAAVVVVGFAAQLLFGALSSLIPSVLGGGPSVVKVASAWLDRGAPWRVTVVNLGLLVCLLPVPSPVRATVSVLVLGALVAFLPLLLRSIGAAVAARRALLASVAEAAEHGGPPVPAVPVEAAPRRSRTQVLMAVASVAVAVILGIAADPAAAGLGMGPSAGGMVAGGGVAARAGVRPTGHTTRVTVQAHDMSYSPSSLTVPYGDRLVIDLVNRDDGSPHDLTFGDGIQTGRVLPGRSATLDALPVDLSGTAAAGFAAHPAALPPLDAARTHVVTLTIEEAELDVAPGVRQKRWTFNATVPGPTLHGRIGDTFVVTLVNHGTMGHSIDFHAGEVAPDGPMRTIAPGASLTYRFTADRAGAWLYHCSTMPMSAHIAAGMHGAVVIEPKGLPDVDRSYVLVQSEVYVDGDGRSSVREVDATAAAANAPDAVVFNGVANQYVARPLTAHVGDRVRFWVLAAGPNRGSSFHVVGTRFDTVWKEGGYLLRDRVDPFDTAAGGSEALDLAAAQGGFVELTPRESGHYPFLTHVMADAERGARGVLTVTP